MSVTLRRVNAITENGCSLPGETKPPQAVAYRIFQSVVNIQGLTKPMSHTVSGYFPPPIKQKSSYHHGSKSEQAPRYRLTFMCLYPFEYYIRCSKCWPFAATHLLRRRIMDSLTRSSWPGRFLMASYVATIRSH